MNTQLIGLLEQCIDRINEGESVEVCLASYPEHAKELEPLLQVLCDARNACSTTPSTKAITATRQRLNAAIAETNKTHPKTRWKIGFLECKCFVIITFI